MEEFKVGDRVILMDMEEEGVIEIDEEGEGYWVRVDDGELIFTYEDEIVKVKGDDD